jgi:hypothetical protein
VLDCKGEIRVQLDFDSRKYPRINHSQQEIQYGSINTHQITATLDGQFFHQDNCSSHDDLILKLQRLKVRLRLAMDEKAKNKNILTIQEQLISLGFSPINECGDIDFTLTEDQLILMDDAMMSLSSELSTFPVTNLWNQTLIDLAKQIKPKEVLISLCTDFIYQLGFVEQTVDFYILKTFPNIAITYKHDQERWIISIFFDSDTFVKAPVDFLTEFKIILQYVKQRVKNDQARQYY